MNVAGLLFVLVAHYLCGRGLLKLFRVEQGALSSLCLSFIVGVFVVSLAPCILQMAGIVITATPVAICIVVLTALCCAPFLKNFRMPSIKLKFPKMPLLYEWPFVAAMLTLASVSVWRCFYYPPISRDMLTGPELLAEYTVREGTMVNSVYSVDLSTTNNYFKSPYITGLQIVYKLLVCPFGQLWLSILFVCFSAWMYSLIRQRLHPLPAGLLMLIFIATPTLFGYTYVILYDYSNMIFFLLGYYFLINNIALKKTNEFLFSSFLLGVATYIRTETLVIVIMLLPLLLFYYVRDKLPIGKVALRSALFVGIPAACYFICMNIFVKNFVPVHFDLQGQFNTNFGDVSIFFQRLGDIARLIFSSEGITIYGFIIVFFLITVLADAIIVRKFSREAVMLLYGIGVIFIGYAILGYLFPSVVDIANTTKRGLFKAIALIVLYFCASGSVIRISGFLERKEIKAVK